MLNYFVYQTDDYLTNWHDDLWIHLTTTSSFDNIVDEKKRKEKK